MVSTRTPILMDVQRGDFREASKAGKMGPSSTKMPFGNLGSFPIGLRVHSQDSGLFRPIGSKKPLG